MALKKQEFYEGAALHVIAKSGRVKSIRYEAPFFVLNGKFAVMLKYSTRNRSPWGFSFSADEQEALVVAASKMSTIVGLICGSDGVAAFAHRDFLDVAPITPAAVHVACYRDHGEYYQVNGPVGALSRRVAPSSWSKLLND